MAGHVARLDWCLPGMDEDIINRGVVPHTCNFSIPGGRGRKIRKVKFILPSIESHERPCTCWTGMRLVHACQLSIPKVDNRNIPEFQVTQSYASKTLRAYSSVGSPSLGLSAQAIGLIILAYKTKQ